MILYSSPPSPFGRKIKLAAHVLGMIDDITLKPTSTTDPDDDIRSINPLGKIPALVVHGATLYDSRVIMEYLDSRAGGGQIIPASGMDRFICLTAAAKMDGILDAGLLIVYEGRFRSAEMQVETVVNSYRDKIVRGLKSINAGPYTNGAKPDVAEIGLACTLDYLDFRQIVEWRDIAPELVDWMAAFGDKVPGYAQTIPADPK